jgi:hypothetical protein
MGRQAIGMDAPMFAGETNSEDILLYIFAQAQPLYALHGAARRLSHDWWTDWRRDRSTGD